MTTVTRPTAPVLLGDPDHFRNGFPHALFTDLRRHTPVVWSEEAEGPGFWSCLKYEDIATSARNPAVFSSARENGGHRIFDERAVGVGAMGADSPIGCPFISRDPPSHTQQRLPVMNVVNPRRLAAMEARIRSRVCGLLDAAPEGAAFDVVPAVSAPIPIKTLAELLDAPEGSEDKLFEWTNALIGEDDPEMRASPEYMMRALGELMTFAGGLRAQRLDGHGDDLITLISRERDGAEVALRDFFANTILVLVGGNETTRNSISGGLVALARHPEQWERLRADPSLVPSAVSEIVRWVSPVMHMRRTVMEDVEIRGVMVPKGSKILFWYPSANRDEEIWPDAFTFDVGRPAQRHLAFGAGQHVCLGSRLAELQIRIFLEEFLERFARVELVGEIGHIRSNFIDGIKSLPMRFTRLHS